jgi:hypothetical protein
MVKSRRSNKQSGKLMCGGATSSGEGGEGASFRFLARRKIALLFFSFSIHIFY